MGPIFAGGLYVFWLLFLFKGVEYQGPIINAMKVFIGLIALGGFIEAGFNPKSNLEYYCAWVPVYYAVLHFDLDYEKKRSWSWIYFKVCSASILVSLYLGPLSFFDQRTVMLLATILAHGVLLLVFNEFAKYVVIGESFEKDLSLEKETSEGLRTVAIEASQANEVKSGFIANIGNEFKAPLDIIMGFTRLLRGGGFMEVSPEKTQEYILDIERSAAQLRSLVDATMELSSVKSGQLKLDEDIIDVPDLLNTMIAAAKRAGHGRKISFEGTFQEGLSALKADKRIFQLIISNLLLNAAKFSYENGVVGIRADMTDHGTLMIEIYDNGPGFETIVSSHVDGQAAPEDGSGKGLGLPLVKTLANLLNANFELDSKMGQGTKATIEFPASALVKTRK